VEKGAATLARPSVAASGAGRSREIARAFEQALVVRGGRTQRLQEKEEEEEEARERALSTLMIRRPPTSMPSWAAPRGAATRSRRTKATRSRSASVLVRRR
jgi:hypothetical protein